MGLVGPKFAAPFRQNGSLTNNLFLCGGDWGKEKKIVRAILLGWLSLIGKCRSIVQQLVRLVNSTLNCGHCVLGYYLEVSK